MLVSLLELPDEAAAAAAEDDGDDDDDAGALPVAAGDLGPAPLAPLAPLAPRRRRFVPGRPGPEPTG